MFTNCKDSNIRLAQHIKEDQQEIEYWRNKFSSLVFYVLNTHVSISMDEKKYMDLVDLIATSEKERLAFVDFLIQHKIVTTHD